MAKDKNKVNVKGMSLEQLEAAAERASGSQKTKIVNEIAKRRKLAEYAAIVRFVKSIPTDSKPFTSARFKAVLQYKKIVAENKEAKNRAIHEEFFYTEQ